MAAKQERDRRARELDTSSSLVRRRRDGRMCVLRACCVQIVQPIHDAVQAHMVNAINGDLLSENPMQGRDPATGRIVSTDRFKGFLPAELRNVRDEQTAQVIEKEMTRDQRLAEERLSAKVGVAPLLLFFSFSLN